MVKPELVSEQAITFAEAKHELESIKKRFGDLNFRAAKCEEYLNDFAHLSHNKATELSKKLKDLNITRLKDEYMVRIVDILPRNAEEVSLIFQGSNISISKKDTEQIVSVVQEYVK